jgi:KDO2-lipid IV(A) lauroyltransferase
MRRPDPAGLVVLGWRVAGRLPGWLLRALCTAAADVTWLRRTAGVHRLEANLRRVRPDASPRALRRLSRAGMRSYMRYYGEAFALASLTPEQVAARVRATGLDWLEPRLAAGEPVVLALAHTGNWDLAGAWATVHLAPVTTVVERLRPEALFQQFLTFREGLGMSIVPLGDGGGGDVFRQLVVAARQGPRLLPLLADRDLTAHGVEVDLFGERARVAVGPAALALSTGAALGPATIYYERLHGARRAAAGSPWGIVIEFREPVTLPDGVPKRERVRVLSQAWVDSVATGIAEHPQDWHMLQKVFVADLDAQRYASTVAPGSTQVEVETP